MKLKATILAAVAALFSTMAHAEKTFIYEQTMYPQEYCLALNMYYEARGSSHADRIAVSDVVLNRVKDSRYPDTICEVVYQARMKPSWKDPEVMIPIRNQCQFSWFCDGKDDTPKDIESFNNALYLAYHMVNTERYVGLTEGATHYHATYVTPSWSRDFTRVGRIGVHIFYRWD